ncbi:MAG: GntR family transcriptional regulator [Devosia sp.]|uniref:GntR family transcriptional regulator n=1 Tax=Devosia sp. TaxID=1871048 RepID=UPI002612DC78|nr:GntR family transcriptional regulator [Devosia sp.]MDB5531114.1 GntR family transcriptional regulator [Devosia sp.]
MSVVGQAGEAGSVDARLKVAEVVSLSDYAYTCILEQIFSGKIAPGTILQERRIAEALSISRTPVREALGRLEAELLVTRSHGRAPVVSHVGVESFVSILDMRRILEVECAGRATGHLGQNEADRVVAEINALLAMSAPTPVQHWAVDDLVHETIADAAGNPLVASTIRDLRRRTRLFNTTRIRQRLTPGASEHLKMIAAIMSGDPDLSREVMGRHLDNVRDAIIEYLLGAKRS